jgi:hypothetical protein
MSETNWTTNSNTNGDLTGSMIMNGDKVTSYSSTPLGVTDNNPTMLGGTGLNFKVEFTITTGKSSPPNKVKYHINAHKDGSDPKKYEGTSGKDSAAEGAVEAADDWTATDNGPEPAAY